MSHSGGFVSDGGIEVSSLEDILAQAEASVMAEIEGPSTEIVPETCFTEEEFIRQRSALEMLAAQVEMFKQVGNHVEALFDLADNLADAAEEMRTAPVAIAHGAYPEEISQVEDDIAQSVFELEAAVRAYATALANKYGIEI